MRGRGSLLLGVVAALALVAASGYVIAPSARTLRVVDVRGTPIPGATVTASSIGAGSLRTVSGPGGIFRVSIATPLLQPRLSATAPGFLDGGEEIAGTLVLHRRPILFGRLLDDADQGLDHAVVTAAVGPREWQTVADAQGFFWLTGALEPGHGFLVVTADGHDAYRAELDLEADHYLEIHAVMSRQLGTLVISTVPPGVAPLLDGAPIPGCSATPCSVQVPSGEHEVEVNAEDYVPWQAPVTVWEGSQLAVPAGLERKTGTLHLGAPAGANATLFVDGQPVNVLSWTGVLPTGHHVVYYTADDHWPAALSVDVGWNQTVSVEVHSAAVSAGDEAGFQAGMAQYLASLPGQFSAWLTPVAGGSELGYQPTLGMEAASVIKIPVALYTEKAAQDGTIKMTDKVTLEDVDFMGGTGTLYGTAQVGDQYTYAQLLALLIQESDNTAWLALDRVLGVAQVDAYAAGIGAPDCHQGDDGCNAREAGLMLQKLAAGRLLDAAHTQDLLTLLETTVFNDRINYYLGGYTIAHKVGMDGSVINDVGVVYAGRPFVVSMFTAADPAVGVEAIRQVSRLALRLYGG